MTKLIHVQHQVFKLVMSVFQKWLRNNIEHCFSTVYISIPSAIAILFVETINNYTYKPVLFFGLFICLFVFLLLLLLLFSITIHFYYRSHSIKERHAVSPTQKDVTLNARKPWPATLVLPTNFRPDVTRVLQAKEAGKMMEPKQRLSFIKTLYEHFSMYTL